VPVRKKTKPSTGKSKKAGRKASAAAEAEDEDEADMVSEAMDPAAASSAVSAAGQADKAGGDDEALYLDVPTLPDMVQACLLEERSKLQHMQSTALKAVRQSMLLQATYAQKLLHLDHQAARLQSLQRATEARERLNEKLSEELRRVLRTVRADHAQTSEASQQYQADIEFHREQYKQQAVHGTEHLAGRMAQADLEAWLKQQTSEKARRDQLSDTRKADLEVLEQANQLLQPGQEATEQQIMELLEKVRQALENLMLSSPGVPGRKQHSPAGSGASSAGPKADGEDEK
jgi:hypothetical protein